MFKNNIVRLNEEIDIFVMFLYILPIINEKGQPSGHPIVSYRIIRQSAGLETAYCCNNTTEHHYHNKNDCNDRRYNLLCLLVTEVKHVNTSFLKGPAMRAYLLPSITIMIFVLHHNLKKNKLNTKETIQAIMDRESAANFTRKQDISGLPYIKVPLDTLPLDITLNEEKKQSQIADYRQKILELSEKPMLNLIGISNTELKEKYGPANLEQLSYCDQNYSLYIRTLNLFAQCIYESYPAQAVKVLEYCLSIGTDISGTYDLLGRHYLSSGNREEFMKLYDAIPQPDSLAGKVIIRKLDSIKNEF